MGPPRCRVDNVSGKVTLRYNGATIFAGQVWIRTPQRNGLPGRFAMNAAKITAGTGNTAPAPAFSFGVMEARGNHDAYEQDFRFRLMRAIPGAELELIGAVTASGEAFAAETLSDSQRRFPLIRTSVGPSRNLRNNAVYDRHWDRVLYGPGDGATRKFQLVPHFLLCNGNGERKGRAAKPGAASCGSKATFLSDDPSRDRLRADLQAALAHPPVKHHYISLDEPWRPIACGPIPRRAAARGGLYEDKIDEALIHRVADVPSAKPRDHATTHSQIDDGDAVT